MKKDQTISVLTVAKLAELVPANTKIYFRDLGSGSRDYVPACEEDITWELKGGRVYLNVGEDDED